MIAKGSSNYNRGAETYETNPELLEAMTKKLIGEDYEIIVGGLTEPKTSGLIGTHEFDFVALLKNNKTGKMSTYDIKVHIDTYYVIVMKNAYDVVLKTDKYEKSNNEPPVELECSEVYELECERVEEAKKAAENK